MNSSSKPNYGLNSRIPSERKTHFYFFKLLMQFSLEENKKHFNYKHDEFPFRKIIK